LDYINKSLEELFLIKLIFAILIITLIGSSPLPALPAVIFFYKKYSFLNSLIIILSSTFLITLFQYHFGKYISKKNYKIFNISKKLNDLKLKLKGITTFDIFMVRLANIGIHKLITFFCGYISYPLYKTLYVNLITCFVFHFFYFYLSKKIDLISNLFESVGLNVSISVILSIISLSSLFALVLKILKYFFFKKFKVNKLNH